MPDARIKKRLSGAALFLVLGTLIVVVILSQVMLSAMLSQTHISRHHVGRIQAYYAAQAGMNYALEQLRTGTWHYTPTNDCPPTALGISGPCDITDSSFPSSIGSVDGSSNRQFRVVFCPPGSPCTPADYQCTPPPLTDFCVVITVNYASPDLPT